MVELPQVNNGTDDLDLTLVQESEEIVEETVQQTMNQEQSQQTLPAEILSFQSILSSQSGSSEKVRRFKRMAMSEKLCRILLVDDEPFNIKGLMIILNKVADNLDLQAGLIESLIDVSYNGQQAVDMVKNSTTDGIQYSLILMDQSMPLMDGTEATS
jgi:CheY-like chemotaxis protein